MNQLFWFLSARIYDSVGFHLFLPPKEGCGSGSDAFLAANEIQRMKLLFQRPHVLSHRQGIVDQAYIDRSGDTS
jgi:hypothetical protein